MELFKTFGIDLYLTAAQVVNFIVIFYILKRFLYRPLSKILEQRKQLAKETVTNAEKSKKAFEKAEAQEKEIILKAHEASSQIIKDAKEQSQDIMRQAEENTKRQTERMIEDAKIQIAQETLKAEQQLNSYVSKLSVAVLKKSLTNILSEKEQDELVKKAVKELQKKAN